MGTRNNHSARAGSGRTQGRLGHGAMAVERKVDDGVNLAVAGSLELQLRICGGGARERVGAVHGRENAAQRLGAAGSNAAHVGERERPELAAAIARGRPCVGLGRWARSLEHHGS